MMEEYKKDKPHPAGKAQAHKSWSICIGKLLDSDR